MITAVIAWALLGMEGAGTNKCALTDALLMITHALLNALLMLYSGVEAAATECERPFRCRDNHIHFEKFCCVVTDNICELLELAEYRGIPYRNRDHHEDQGDSAALAFSDSFFF